MGEREGAYRFMVKKSEGMRTLEDERKISKCTFKKWDGGMDRIGLAQGRGRWWVLVNAVVNLLCSLQCGEFLDYWRTCCLL
jgi:hypothetical protein